MPPALAPTSTQVKFNRLNRGKFIADEAIGVSGQVVAVTPEVPPDAERVAQRGRDHRRGERFEDDRPAVVDPVERPESAAEVH